MPQQTVDTIIQRVERVKHSLAGAGDPRAVQAAVDGVCPNEDCDGRVVAVVHADTAAVTCEACGSTFQV